MKNQNNRKIKIIIKDSGLGIGEFKLNNFKEFDAIFKDLKKKYK